MIKVIGVRFRQAGKIYYFSPGKLKINRGDHVIVETARGVEYGYVVVGNRDVEDDRVVQPLKPVIRMATEQDDQQAAANKEKEKEAFKICKEKIKKHGLEMKLIDTEYTFDNNKVLFYFTADGRIDFRRDQDHGWYRHLRKTAVLQYPSVGVPAGIDQDGKGAESVSESDQDLRCVRATHVLSQA